MNESAKQEVARLTVVLAVGVHVEVGPKMDPTLGKMAPLIASSSQPYGRLVLSRTASI